MSDQDAPPPQTTKRPRGNPSFFKGMPSLNPKGRTKGSINKFTKLSRELMSSKGPEIVDKVIELALEGDRHCLKMCLDRIIPVSKAVEIKHEHEDLGINIIVESVKAIEKREEAEFKVIEGEVSERIDINE
tara:strand:+ start:935 stop:1327 length:393 start_codon:yes stop_codon:yes gene_type:complete